MKQSVALALSLIFLFVVATPVSAAPPVIETFDFDEDYTAFDPSTCGFEIRDHEVYTIRQTSYFDNQGNPVRIHIHVSGTDNFYTPENPGIVLSGSFTVNGEIDLETGDFVWVSGVPWHITLPGYGTVVVRAGRWSEYPGTPLAGRDSFLIAADMEQFCEALSTVSSASVQATVGASEPHSVLFLPTVIARTQQ